MQLTIRIKNLSKEDNDKVLDKHKERVASVSTVMPVIMALGNRDLKERHWKKIFEHLDGV